MKNKIKFILAVFVTILVLSSCEEKIMKQKDLPIEVVKLKEAKAYDTLLIISTEKSNYVFKKNNEYLGVYENTYLDSTGYAIVMTFVAILFFFVLTAVLSKN